jgi:hypothetical protein
VGKRDESGRTFLYIDPSTAGIAGSMLLGGLLDGLAPADRQRLLRLFRKAFSRAGFEIESGEVRRRGFRGFYVDGTNQALKTEKLAREANRAAGALELSAPAREFAEGVVDLLIELESEVHGEPRAQVHLHELAGYDTVFDAAATARVLDEVGFFEAGALAFARPVEVGSGFATFSHGTTPVPPPVCELILQRHRIPFTQHADREVATPTGLALLALLKPRFSPPPAAVVRARGVGAGRMELPDRANLLYVQIRETLEGRAARAVYDPVAQLEVSLDDVSGETAGHALSRALDEGALDAHLVFTATKKGRPGHLLLVLTREEDAERIADGLAQETGSWGVRIAHRVTRLKAVPREQEVPYRLGRRSFSARVKFLEQGNRLVRVKAEYEDVAAAARSAGVTLAEAREAAERAARAILEGKVKRG